MEDAQSVVITLLQNPGKVDLQVAAGAGPGTVVIKTPDLSIGQQSPSNPAVRHAVGSGEISENLAVRTARLDPVVPIPDVEREAESLALFHCKSIPEAFIRLAFGGGTAFGLGVREEQVVGNVLVTGCALLR